MAFKTLFKPFLIFIFIAFFSLQRAADQDLNFPTAFTNN